MVRKQNEMTTLEALSVLELKQPFTQAELRSRYRQLSLMLHPDRGGTQDDFIRLTAAEAVLRPLASANHADESGCVTSELMTIDGKLLSSLGRGYPLTEAAKSCEGCTGRGWVRFNDFRVVNCEKCYGDGYVTEICSRCHKCDGTGRFTKGGRDVGFCFSCGGTGIFRKGLKRAARCDVCHGTGFGREKLHTWIYQVCGECQGVGEIRMWNPVLHRGLMTARKK